MRRPSDAHDDTQGPDDGCVELALAGDLDMAETFRIEPEADRLLAGEGVRRLILDLAGVEFIDSAGIGALLSIRQRAEQLGVEMSLANVTQPVRRVLDVSGSAAVLLR